MPRHERCAQLSDPQTSKGFNELFSVDTDVPSFSRVLWAVAMFGEVVAESFWTHMRQCELWAQGSEINLTTSRELLSLLYSQRVSKPPPKELVSLIETTCLEIVKKRPSSGQICTRVQEILRTVSMWSTLLCKLSTMQLSYGKGSCHRLRI